MGKRTRSHIEITVLEWFEFRADNLPELSNKWTVLAGDHGQVIGTVTGLKVDENYPDSFDVWVNDTYLDDEPPEQFAYIANPQV